MATYMGKYVVSMYRPGQSEWIQGHYFDDRNKAFGYWMTTTIENTPITDIDIHPRFADNVENLSIIARYPEETLSPHVKESV
jgi:hypothetical protein